MTLILEWNPRSRVIPFGSVRLGAALEDSDVDLCVLCDHLFPRATYMESFLEFIRARAEDVVPVLDTYVPVIKFVYRGQHIDCVFSCVDVPDLPGRDVPCVSVEDTRSLQGVIATERILALVPERRKQIFPHLLRVSKEWAKARGIYSNPMGLLNGMALAVMCLYVCLSVPDEFPDAHMFRQFVRTFASWDWDTRPLVIGTLIMREPMRYMNVYTPVEDPLNALYNVGPFQRHAIVNEFRTALATIHNPCFVYEDVLETFFRTNHVFAMVRAASPTRDAHNAWKARVESRIKWLLTCFEGTRTVPTVCTKPFSLGDRVTFFFVALSQPLDSDAVCTRFLQQFATRPAGCVVTLDFVLQKDLPAFVFD